MIGVLATVTIAQFNIHSTSCGLIMCTLYQLRTPLKALLATYTATIIILSNISEYIAIICSLFKHAHRPYIQDI